MLRRQTTKAMGAGGLDPAKRYAGSPDVYAELSINFQYDTRAGLRHAGRTQEGD